LAAVSRDFKAASAKKWSEIPMRWKPYVELGMLRMARGTPRLAHLGATSGARGPANAQ
jgi:hypothetical protein